MCALWHATFANAPCQNLFSRGRSALCNALALAERGDMAMDIFHDRIQAGKLLATQLEDYAGRSDVIVLALPRGGVPVAFEVAQALVAPLDLMLVRKLGVPGHEEYAMGAVASGGTRVVNRDAVDMLEISDEVIEAAAEREMQEIARRDQLYRHGKPQPDLHGRTVILVDDGLATGATMMAAVQAARDGGAAHIVAAAPVGAADTCITLSAQVDRMVCLHSPEPFRAVGLWYRKFPQLSDKEVIDLLAQAEQGIPGMHIPPAANAARQDHGQQGGHHGH
jgi:putative phosphoribosyl transferase